MRLILLALIVASPTWAKPSLSVTDWKLVRQKVSPTVTESEYEIIATNKGTAAKDVEATANPLSSEISMQTAFVFWPRIAAGTSAASTDHFVFRHRPQYAPKPADVRWGIGGSDGDFTGRFVAAPSTPLSTLITNYSDSTPYAKSAIEGGVLRTDLSIDLASDATVGQVQPAFDRVKATVTGMMEGRLIIGIRIPDPGSRAALDAIVKTLRGTPGIEDVSLSSMPVPALIAPKRGL